VLYIIETEETATLLIAMLLMGISHDVTPTFGAHLSAYNEM
jgi:hypothetical protein